MEDNRQGEFEFPEVDYFGGCPTCTGNDGYRNIGREHFMLCHKHRVYWHVGSNLFSSWHDESEALWQDNARQLSTYTEVEPLLPPRCDQPESKAAFFGDESPI